MRIDVAEGAVNVHQQSSKKTDYTRLEESISKLIDNEMRLKKIAGVSIALVDGQNIVWNRSFGYADKANSVPVSSDTVYFACSITKVFTATAVMQLAEQDLIDIDKPFQYYVPEFSIKTHFKTARPITVRDLLTHQAGIPSNKLKTVLLPDGSPEPFHKVLDFLADQYAVCAPGTIYLYSNIAFDLLAILIEHVSGLDYIRYMQDNILLQL